MQIFIISIQYPHFYFTHILFSCSCKVFTRASAPFKLWTTSWDRNLINDFGPKTFSHFHKQKNTFRNFKLKESSDFHFHLIWRLTDKLIYLLEKKNNTNKRIIFASEKIRDKDHFVNLFSANNSRKKLFSFQQNINFYTNYSHKMAGRMYENKKKTNAWHLIKCVKNAKNDSNDILWAFCNLFNFIMKRILWSHTNSYINPGKSTKHHKNQADFHW